jgi:hypothetical protein
VNRTSRQPVSIVAFLLRKGCGVNRVVSSARLMNRLLQPFFGKGG